MKKDKITEKFWVVVEPQYDNTEGFAILNKAFTLEDAKEKAKESEHEEILILKTVEKVVK